MRLSFLSLVSALAFTGLSLTLAPSTAGAHDPAVAQSTTEEDSDVSVLPEDASVVYVGGEACWLSHGAYYRPCDRGFRVFHPVLRTCERVDRCLERHTTERRVMSHAVRRDLCKARECSGHVVR